MTHVDALSRVSMVGDIAIDSDEIDLDQRVQGPVF